RRILDAAALLLGDNLIVQFPGHAVEFRNHALNLGNLPPLLIYLEPLQADHSVTRLHETPHSLRILPDVKKRTSSTQPTRRQPREQRPVANLSFTSRVNHAGGSLNPG